MKNAYLDFLSSCQTGIRTRVALAAEDPNVQNCQIRLYDEKPPEVSTPTVVAYLRIDKPTGRALVHFVRNSIPEVSWRLCFAKGLFSVSDDYSLSTGVIEALGWKGNKYEVTKGFYPLLEDAEFITASLRIKKYVSSPSIQKNRRGTALAEEN